MMNIKRINVINTNKLDKEFYFKSIIEEAYYCNLLTEAEIEKIQYQCLELLAYKTERYNCGDSSSIRIELAESIMKSNLYTIGLKLKSFQNTDDAVKALKNIKILELYNSGRNCIETKLKATKHIFMLVMQNKLDTDNYTYNATVKDAIEGFFKIYNPDYEAHEIHITADYPLCNHVENLVGVEFIQKYLESIYYENMFCRYFSSDDIHHLLCGYDEGYRDLLINIFEQVFTTAIGCKIAGINAAKLNISKIKIKYLYGVLLEKNNEEIRSIVLKAYVELRDDLYLKSSSLQQYMEKSLPTIISNICNASKERMLDKVFIIPKYPELNPKIHFSFGKKMNNEQYRNIIDEIMHCRYLSDKIAIIKSNIQSLGDLEDLLFDAELSATEIATILNELEIVEVAALAKRHPFSHEIEAIDLSESEQGFRLCLHNYILAQPLERQNWIINTINLLDDDDQQQPR